MFKSHRYYEILTMKTEKVRPVENTNVCVEIGTSIKLSINKKPRKRMIFEIILAKSFSRYKC